MKYPQVLTLLHFAGDGDDAFACLREDITVNLGHLGAPGGVGNLVGFLGTGWWFDACSASGHTRWPVFWMGLVAAVAAVLVYFLAAYRGIGNGFKRAKI